MDEQHTKELIEKLVILEKDYMNQDAAYAKECGREHLVTEDQVNEYLYDMYSKMPKQELINLYNENLA